MTDDIALALSRVPLHAQAREKWELLHEAGAKLYTSAPIVIETFTFLGRNMFGPVRGPWPDESWKGWWGDNPPYHAPVLVLTHHARAPIEMKGGTTFYFFTEGLDAALAQAKAAAGERDIKIGGGVATIRQCLKAGVIDELHLALSPVVLGYGEALLTGIDLPAFGYSVTEHAASEHATHVVLTKA